MAIIHISSSQISTSGELRILGNPLIFSSGSINSASFLGTGLLSSSFSSSVTSRISSLEGGSPGPSVDLTGNTLTIQIGTFSSSVDLPLSGTVTTSTAWTSLTGVPNLISGAAQIASAISGANSASIASRISAIESNYLSGSLQIASNISGAFGQVSTSLSERIGSFLTYSSSNLAGDVIRVDSVLGRMYGYPTAWAYAVTLPIQIDSQSAMPGGVAFLRATTPNGLTFTGSNATISYVGDMNLFNPIDVNFYEIRCLKSGPSPEFTIELLGAQNSTGSVISKYAAAISGAFTLTSQSFSSSLSELNSKSLLSGSAQIAGNISGAFGQVSSSIAGGTANIPSSSIANFNTAVSAAVAAAGFGTPSGSSTAWNSITGKPSGLVSSSAQLSSDISGAFTAASASLVVRIDAVSSSNATLQSKTLLSGSAQIAANISGAFGGPSASLSASIAALQAKTLLSGSAQIAANISGAVDAVSASIADDISTLTAEYVEFLQAYLAYSASFANGTAQTPSSSIIQFNSAVSAAAAAAGFGTPSGSSTAWNSITGKPAGLLSASSQIASEISGAFSAASAGLSTSIANTANNLETHIGTYNSLAFQFETLQAKTLVSGTDFSETVFRVSNNSNPSKKVRFELSAIASGSTRVITMPDADVNLGNLGGSSTSTASSVFFAQASASQLSSSNVHGALVEINARLPITASFPAIPYNAATGAAFNMQALELTEGLVTESGIFTALSTALFPAPNYSGSVANFKAGRIAVSGGYYYQGISYDSASASGSVVRIPLFETVDALSLSGDTITKLENEAYWLANNVYSGPAITGSDLVPGKEYYKVTEQNVWFECMSGSSNYWVRRGNRVPAILSWKLTPYGVTASASITVPKDVDVFERDFYLIDTWLYASTGPTGATASADIRDDGTSVFSSSVVTVLAGAKSGSQRVTARLISSGSEVSVFLTNTGSSNPGQNYKVTAIGFWKM